jgi:hypothetical protein
VFIVAFTLDPSNPPQRTMHEATAADALIDAVTEGGTGGAG